MPVKTPLHGVTVQRKDEDGNIRNVYPPIGKPFEFTDREIATFAKSGFKGGTLKDAPRGETPIKPAELLSDLDHSAPPPAGATEQPHEEPGMETATTAMALDEALKPKGKGKTKPPVVADEEDDGL